MTDRKFLTGILLTGLGLLLAFAVSAASTNYDMRVVIDVSGSMKQNDPKNLRQPAVKLLVGLMPDGMKSGIWTFGQYVNMQVRHGTVDNDWRTFARGEARNIHSRGLFTNIEEALDKASFGWSQQDKTTQRSLILLTDGMVDISKQQSQNQASRDRIINQLLPRLEKAGVKVHTVGLSDNVDKGLLSKLSATTGGWYEEARSAEDLQRIFLRLFEKSVDREQIPIKGNRFTVDSSVDEMTLVLFKKSEQATIRMKPPHGQIWDKKTHAKKAIWFVDTGYELITVKKPDAGEWILETESDPDNRVMVVTNLNLGIDPVPEHRIGISPLRVNAFLEDKGKLIDNRDFLKLVTFTINLDGNEKEMKPDAQGGAYFTAEVQPGEGIHSLTINAEGATFARSFNHRFQVHKSIVESQVQFNDGHFSVRLIPNLQLIDPTSLTVTVAPEADDPEKTTAIEFKKGIADQWLASLDESWANKVLKVKVQATTHQKKEISDSLAIPLKIPGTEQHHGQAPLAKEHSETVEKDKAVQEHSDSAVQDGDKTQEPIAGDEHEEGSSVVTIVLIAVGNLLLVLLIVGGFFFWKRRKSKLEAQEDKELEL